MSIEIEEVSSASIPTPPADFHNLFFDSADGLFKAKDENGDIVVFGSQNTLVFGNFSGVPAGGTLYLRCGQGAFSNSAPYRLFRDGVITGASIRVDTADASRDYDMEIVDDPTGSPSVLATLSMSNVVGVTNGALSAVVSSDDDIGVRLVRTSGAGASSFTNITVLVEIVS